MQRLRTKPSKQHSTLYRIVFASWWVRIAVCFLFFIFLIQPIAPVYANEMAEEVASEELVSSEVVEAVESVSIVDTASAVSVGDDLENLSEGSEDDVQSVDSQDESRSNNVVNETVEDDQMVETQDTESSPVRATTSVSAKATSTEITNEDSDLDTTTSTSSSVLSSSTVTRIETISSSSSSAEIATSSADTDVAYADGSSTTSSTTPEVTVPLRDELPVQPTEQEKEKNSEQETNADSVPDPLVEGISSSTVTIAEESTQVNESNKYQFGAQECVSVGTGSYYCNDQPVTMTKAPTDGVYVEIDSDGDREIYIRLGGDVEQLSHNTQDDLAPYYDPISQSVVWHRLIDGRYEIVRYDFETKSEMILTKNDVNDMEPTHAGSYVVWQRWLNNNWEIILYDIESNVEEQLTHNSIHDVAPHIKGDFVIWHTATAAGRQISVYEISTGLTSVIDDSEGGQVENPRFVLVYDTTFDNGDVITKGYDFDTKKVVPLSSTPVELPDQIPSSDSTGETRALIQNKSTNQKYEVVNKPETGTGSSTATSTTTSNQEFGLDDIIITSRPASSTATTTTSLELDLTLDEAPVFELTEYDVVIPPATSTQSFNSGVATSSVE